MSQRTLAYRPALDGVRAVAVAAVLLYHAGLPGVPGGFLGVDVFFVLSGYLITALLLREWRTHGRLDLRSFYARRARRLFPALFAVLLVVSLWAAVYAEPAKRSIVRTDGLSALGYVANWRFILAGQSYFEQFGDPSPFRHMWSLAIEEQFYLVYPLLLVGLLTLARGRRWVPVGVLTLLTVISILLMAHAYLPGQDPSRAYYGTDTRLHELLIGALLRFVVLRSAPGPRRRALASLAGPFLLVALLACFATVHDTSAALYRGGFAAVSVLTAALITALEWAPKGPGARLLSLRPVVAVGVVSYGLYLWHWPVFVALSAERTGWPDVPLFVVRLLVTAALTVACYRYLEKPARRRIRPVNGRWSVLMFRRVGALPVVTLAVAGVSALALTAATAFGVGQGGAGLDAAPLPAPTTGPPTSGPPTRAVLIGDSVPFYLTQDFPASTYPWLTAVPATTLGCALLRAQHARGPELVPTPAACLTGESLVPAQLEPRPNAALLFLGMGELFDASVDGDVKTVGTPAHAQWLSAQLDRIVEQVRARNIPLALVNVGCYRLPSDNSANSQVANDPQRVAALNTEIAAYAGQRSLPLLDLHQALCAQGYTNSVDGVGKLRRDGVHFTPAGAAYVWQILQPTITALAAEPATATPSPTPSTSGN